MLTATLIIASLAQIILGLFVFLKRKNSLTNVLFALLSVATLGWVILNYLTIIELNSHSLIYFVRGILFFVVIQNSFFYLFARTFPGTHWIHSKKWLIAYLLLAVVAACLTVSPYLFVSVGVDDGIATSKAGPAIMVFILHASTSIILAFKDLIRKARKSAGVEKNQLNLLLIASALNWVVVPLTNFLVTNVFKTTFFILVSPVYTLAFIALIAYTIVSQKLFDIRSAVARSVAYVLSVATIIGIYSVSTVGLANYVLRGEDFEKLRGLISIVFAGILAISFQRIKTFFDKTTNKLFYQDAYDPQEVIDNLNKIFVSNVELETLLTKTNEVIENSMKAEFSTFLINKTAYDPNRWIGDSTPKLDETELTKLNEFISKSSGKVIVSEYLEGSVEEKRLLLGHNIAVVVRLIPTIDYELPGIGLLMLGQKKSGNLYSNQDVRLLEIIANELVIAVENALRFEEIEKFTITLQEKVDKATKELRDTNKKLIDLDEAKDEFISMASHQLRTPLTSMKGYVSMVLEGDSGKINDMQRKLLDQAFVSSQRMVYLIADLLNVSRLKTGKFIIEGKPTDLGKVVEEEVSQLVETAKGRNLELTYDKPKDFPLLMLDETKIRQVIMNFTDNAIYYTPAGGHIHVYVEDTGQTIECRVEDDGLGVPKAEQHHLFAKFYRAGNAKKARPDGTGLGLFMAKKVIAAQGGAIIFRSTEGKGSTFGFSFSKTKLKPTPEQLKATTPTTTIVAATDTTEVATEPVETPSKPKK